VAPATGAGAFFINIVGLIPSISVNKSMSCSIEVFSRIGLPVFSGRPIKSRQIRLLIAGIHKHARAFEVKVIKLSKFIRELKDTVDWPLNQHLPEIDLVKSLCFRRFTFKSFAANMITFATASG
jgi:hypothetical protein